MASEIAGESGATAVSQAAAAAKRPGRAPGSAARRVRRKLGSGQYVGVVLSTVYSRGYELVVIDSSTRDSSRRASS